MLGDSRSFVVLTVTTLAVSFICAVALVDMVHAAAQYWVLGLLLGQTVLAVVGTRLLFAKLNMRGNASIVVQDLNKRHFQTLLEFAWPVALAAGLGWVQGQGYRYILESQLGLAQLGLFVAGYGISAGVIAGFESVLTTYFQPRLYRDANRNGPKEQSEAWRRYASAVVPSLIITTALVVILAPELTRIFLGERFQAASDYVVWGALAESARVLAGVYSLIAHVFMRTRWLVLPTAVGAAVAIAACVALLPHMGAAGVGLGLTLAGIAVVALLHLSLVFRVGGGVATSLIWKALAGGGAVWGGVLVVRHIWSHESWGEMASAIAVGGALYLAFLYLFLHRHLMEE
jgi:O-antigen/teichoic acid export membrane protein